MKEERTYIVTNSEVSYTVSARSATAARIKAGMLYRDELKDERPYTATFYAQFFSPRVVDPRKPGPPSVYPQLVEVK